MSDERQQACAKLARAAGITGWVLFAAAAAFAVSLQHSLRKQRDVFDSTMADHTAQLQQANGEKDRLASEFAKQRRSLEDEALFRAARAHEQSRALEQVNEKNKELAADIEMARRDYESAANRRIYQRAENEGTRFIGRDGIARLRAMLHDAPVFDVEIGFLQGNADSVAVAEELRAAFESAGSKVRKLAPQAAPPIALRGVSIHSKAKFDNVMGEVVGQIFREVSQEKNQWVGIDQLPAFSPDAPEADIRIFVGAK